MFWSLYGFLESFIFLLSEKYIQYDLIHKYHIDLAMAELIIGGISASLSFVLATTIGRYFRYKSSYGENVFINGLGILLGSFGVILMYWIFNIH